LAGLPTSPTGKAAGTASWKGVVDMTDWPDASKQQIKSTIDKTAAALSGWHARSQLYIHRCKYLTGLIARDKAVAIGYSKGAAQPKIIPAYLFETSDFINWTKDEIKGNGLAFISVRVTKLRRSEQTSRKNQIPRTSGPRAGRPAYAEINSVIQGLKTDRAFIDAKPQEKIAQIERVLKKRYPNDYSKNWSLSRATGYRYLKANNVPMN
jgi:hypothetical protein